ncbi:MAG: tetratricopeptide repeat protein [Treponemataceae bacterium]|nr:tetratricopeptide repeat protein [Treponemataceae bacterium]
MKRTNSIFLAALLCAALLPAAPLSGAAKTAPELFSEGVRAQERENWHAASQHFMEAVQRNPVYGDAWFHLAQCSYQLGEYDLALSQLDEAEKYSSGDSAVSNLRGMILIALQRFSDARTVFEGVLKTAPNNVDARFGLAELDLFDGRISGAERQYGEALRRQGDNRKALLSLAVVSAQQGKTAAAKKYVSQALQYYSGEAEVHYLAAAVGAMQGDLKEAEKQCRIAVEIDGDYDAAYDLLAKIRYAQGDYDEVIAICDFRIRRDRNLASAWYLKGCAQNQAGRTAEAIETWTSGLRVVPDDEVMRAALELEIRRTVPLEDGRRSAWSSYHVEKAREYARRYDSSGAMYEYQRALKINPSDEEARLAFASMLALNGMYELYLEQLLFLRRRAQPQDGQAGAEARSAADVRMDDTIEAYGDLLQDSLAKKWNVQPFYLDKTRWRLGIYFEDSSVSQRHVEANRIAAEFAADIFSGIASTSVAAQAVPVNGFGDAYRRARNNKMDYFIILSVDEGARDITLDYTMYSGRTGSEIAKASLYSTGNDRYANVFRRFRGEILERLSIRGKVLDRDGKTLLVDVGKSENSAAGSVFDVVRRNSVETAASGAGISYKKEDVLGTLTITVVGEDVSEGILETAGFYDRVNAGDEIVLVSLPPAEDSGGAEDAAGRAIGADTAPSADAGGAAVRGQSAGITAEALGIRRIPSFIDLIRNID